MTTSTPNFFSSQLIALAVSELPAFFASLQEKIFKNQLILDAINYYRDFSTQHLIKGSGRDTNEDRPRLLSTLEHMFLHGNAPANTLLHQDIDFALGGVGCCNNQKVPDTTTTTTTLSDNIIISVESSGDKKSLSNSLLGNPETRAMLMDDLLELYTFLSSRSSLLESPPVAPIHVQVLTNERTLAEIEEYIKIIDPIILTLESSPTSTSFSSSSNTGNNNNNNKFNNRNNLLLMLLGSPTFSQRLAAQFTTELDAMSKLRKRELELQVRVSDQLTKLKEIEESLNVKVKQTVRLVEKVSFGYGDWIRLGWWGVREEGG